MGAELAKFFQEAYEIAGLAGRVQLAQLTKVSSADAEIQADTAEAIVRFRQAMEEIRRQRRTTPTSLPVQALQNLDAAFMHLRDLVVGSRLELDEVVRCVTNASAKALAVERSTIWLFEDDRAVLRCADIYDANRKRHASGIALLVKDLPNYVAAASKERTISARDAHRDPRTRELSRIYFAANGVTSMLGAPVWKQGVLRGIACNEHTGAPRTWTGEEEEFCQSAASLVALALE